MAYNTPNLFLKIIPITLTGGEVSAHQAVRAYTTRIEDNTTVKVYYNGTLIPKGISATAKYYYDLAISLDVTWPGPGPGIPIIPDTSTATFTLKENLTYRGPSYISGYSINPLSTFDAFVISYYHVIYSA